MELIIDTNIIVSALLSPDGRAFQFLSEVFDGKHTVFISQEIYEEYREVLYREKFGFDKDIIEYVLDWFRDNAVWVEVTKSTISVPGKVIECVLSDCPQLNAKLKEIKHLHFGRLGCLFLFVIMMVYVRQSRKNNQQ